MAKKKIQDALKDVRNTTKLVSKFVKLLQPIQADENEVNEFLDAFKTIYNGAPYYTDVKESIIEEIGILGMDTDNASDHL